MFHVFRNTPLGRETLLQSIYFCKKAGVSLNIYIPVSKHFLMYFNHNAVKIDLDKSYLVSPFTALTNASELVAQEGIKSRFFKVETFSASFLPIIPTNFDFMCCPRSISDLPSKIGFNYIGPKVRRIVKFAQFPVLITSSGYKKWRSVAVFYDGSANAVNALKLGLRIGRASGFPLDVFTQTEEVPIEFCEKVIEDKNLKKEMSGSVNKWHIFEKGSFEENLYNVPHDALVVLGAYNHSPIKNMVFGSKLEKIRSTLPNNLLIAGPRYTEPNSSLPTWFSSL